MGIPPKKLALLMPSSWQISVTETPCLARFRAPMIDLLFAVLALAHDDLLARTAIMPKFQLSVVRF
ncbi:MAG: hypothetical protein R6V56_01030 [Lentisphaeria bacterium]